MKNNRRESGNFYCHKRTQTLTMNSQEPDYDGLMSKRIRRILLVCNSYDSFALEEDGRIEQQIVHDYAQLNIHDQKDPTGPSGL